MTAKAYIKSPQHLLELLEALNPVYNIYMAESNGSYQRILFDVVFNHCNQHNVGFYEISIAELLVCIETAQVIFRSLNQQDGE